MATKLNWGQISDSEGSVSDQEPQSHSLQKQKEKQQHKEVPNLHSTKSQTKSQIESESLSQSSSSYNPKGKRPTNEVNHKYTSAAMFRETFKTEQLELLEKIEGKLVYLFVFKINHSLFAPTVENLDCISKVEQEKGWELKLDKAYAKKLLVEGLPNNMYAKMQLSNKNFYVKSERRYPNKPPKSETNTEDTKSNYQKEVKSMTLTDNSDIASKDFSERSSNVSREKIKQPSTTYGNKQKGKEYSKVYYKKQSYDKPKNYQKPKYKLKEGSVCSEEVKVEEREKEAFESDEEAEVQMKQKKLKIEQEVKKKIQKKKREKKNNDKKERPVPKAPDSPVKTVTKTKSNNPFASLDD